MSRNKQKIIKALAAKGYRPANEREGIFQWEPVGHACEMCGPEGGCYIDVMSISVDEYGESDHIDTLLGYSTDEILEAIEDM